MITAFLILLAVHWIADFVLQNDWMAQGKSKRAAPLLAHVFVYSTVFGLSSLFVVGAYAIAPGFGWWVGFVWANGALHLATDYVTSRATARLWAAGDRHNFFVMIGFDQLIHQFTIALTMGWFFQWT